MKRTLLLRPQQIQLLFFFLIAVFITACRDEKDKEEEPNKSEAYYQGEIRFEHLDQETVPGLYKCYFTNREDLSELVVTAIAYSKEGDVVFIPETPIRTGEYYFNRVVAVQTDDKKDEELIGQDVALGCKVDFTAEAFSVKPEEKDPQIGCFGTGTEEDPYRITSYNHLKLLMKAINTEGESNRKYRDKYYSQLCDISLLIPSTNLNNGWNSIGNSLATPFAGHYDGNTCAITDMYIQRNGNIVSQPSGLFGIIVNATIEGVVLESCEISSEYPIAGMLVGTVVSTGGKQLTSSIKDCMVLPSCTMKAPYLAGGLVGGVDQFARLIMIGCDNRMSISCDKPGVGGLIGAAFLTSSVTLDNCTNQASLTSQNGIVGGLIGSADTLLLNNCTNSGAITGGANSIGTGGLVGGGTNVVASYCSNNGKVTGGKEVGGILGSAARNSKEKIYGDVHLYSSSNNEVIKGVSEVGGLVGSAQILISGCYNFEAVSATSKNVGGLAGLGPIAVIVNSTNDANVSCTGGDDDNYVGGILGSAQDFLLTACSNYGNVSMAGKGTTGGIIGGCDMLGILSYCGNYGDITGGNGSVGGIIGRAGKPKNMSDKMIADMVLGTALGFASVGMAGAQMGGGKASKMSTAAIKRIDIAGKVLNAFTSINDLHWTAYNNTLHGSTLTPEGLQHLQVEIDNTLQTNHANQIKNMTWGNYTEPAKKQRELQDSLVSRLAQSMTTYDNNVDQWRNNVEGKMRGAEKRREVASHVGEGISFVGDILGFCPVPNPVSIVTTLVITLYNLIMNLTDYSYNRVGLIQCYNYGTVTAQSGNYGGGIAGELHDYARLYNSANLGTVTGGNYGMLIGKGGHLPEVTHSVNFVKKDNGSYTPLYYSCPFNGEIRHNVNNGDKDASVLSNYEEEGFDLTKAWTWHTGQNMPLINRSQFE